MHPFTYIRATDADAAVAAFGSETAYLAGGTDLLQLLKADVLQPLRIIDVGHLPDADRIEHRPDGGVFIGASATLAEVARSAVVRDTWPMVAEALLQSASAQVRNMATIGGNVLQRTRCAYFRDITLPCNKREPGTGCPARAGEHRSHAIFGTSEHCIAAHASDLAVALTAADAIVYVQGRGRSRTLPIANLYLLPDDNPEREVTLSPGELITGIGLASPSASRLRQSYTKIRDRRSFEFALVSLACALDVDAFGVIRSVRLAAGGVGTIPWRLSAVEALLGDQHAEPTIFAKAGELSVKGAQPGSRNQFKVKLLRNLVTRVLSVLAGVE